MGKVKTALISVHDKTGSVALARMLKRFNVEIISTGGTAKLLKQKGIAVTEISRLTGMQELLGGRVKTLHPKVHAGILAKGTQAHFRELKKNKIKPIDLVVVNLYPFEKTVKKTGNLEKIIENIDIGGVTLIRAAAKNFSRVCTLTKPNQYGRIISELMALKGCISLKTRKEFATEAFETTAFYDSLVFSFFQKNFSKDFFPISPSFAFEKITDCRYGENYHQKAAFYKEPFSAEPSLSSAVQLNGKEMSFNNYLDSNAATEIVKEFDKPCAAIIKHTIPCGVACAKQISAAFNDALNCDPKSAFGGVIALNRKCDFKTAKKIVSFFNEVVIAPEFDSSALKLLSKRKRLRVLKIPRLEKAKRSALLDFKKVTGGLLVQERNLSKISKRDLKFVSKRRPSKKQIESLVFAWKVVKHVKSNAIVLARETKTIAIVGGQTSRVGAVKIAAKRAGKKARGSVLASDGFFPFADNIVEAARAGVSSIIEPGGSIKDKEVIAKANNRKISLVFTGFRNFKH